MRSSCAWWRRTRPCWRAWCRRCRECALPPPPPPCSVSSATPTHPATRLLMSGCPTLMCLCDRVSRGRDTDVCGMDKASASCPSSTIAIKEQYQRTKSHKEKQCIAKIVAKRIQQYRMTNTAHAMLGIPQDAVMIRDDSLLGYNRKTHESSRRRLSTAVDKLFCREDNSRTTTGKRDTVSKGGIKKQRSLLLAR